MKMEVVERSNFYFGTLEEVKAFSFGLLMLSNILIDRAMVSVECSEPILDRINGGFNVTVSVQEQYGHSQRTLTSK